MKQNEKTSEKIKNNLMKRKATLPVIILIILVTIFAPKIDELFPSEIFTGNISTVEENGQSYTIDYLENRYEIPGFSGEPFYVLNDNKPIVNLEDLKNKDAYEEYGPLDELGRCTETEAIIGLELMPTEPRESISSVKPTGWNGNNNEYDFVDGKRIYNRCHLIGFQLTGENANRLNLITGTRYLNVDGMLPFENMVADYIKETENKVFYRVTPVYVGEDLVAIGVIMEAISIEDNGEGICFNVFCYNNQPGVEINYTTGENWAK